MNQQSLWLWMQQQFGTGTRRAHEALLRYGDPQGLLSLSAGEIERDGFLNNIQKSAVLKRDFSEAEQLVNRTLDFGGTAITPQSMEYPDNLKNIYAKPYILFCKGDMSVLQAGYPIAMVGTRKPDEYGIAAARKLGLEIAGAGGTVVSGLAVGIDAACHTAAMDGGGKTIAFIATGLDVDYPQPNRELRKRIEQNGLVISEYPMGTLITRGTFPIRNRLISGMSLAVIIVQCSEKSGTMITASHATAQNRDLFAVPGSILSENFSGPNSLLQEGATPAVSGENIVLQYVDIYGYPRALPMTDSNRETVSRVAAVTLKCPNPVEKKPPIPREIPDNLDSVQREVLTLLRLQSENVDSLSEKTGQEPHKLLATLTLLEIYGLATALPGGSFAAL